MTSGSSSQRGAIGSQSNITHKVMPEQLVSQLQQATRDNPGSDFIIVQRLRQGEEPRIWTTSDTPQARQLFKQAQDVFESEPATS